MNLLVAMMAGVAGGAVSAVVGFVATLLICQAMNVHDREGAVGFLGIFAGLLTGVVGMILSIVLTLRWRRQSTASVVMQTPLALAGILAVAVAGVAFSYYSEDHPIVNGAPPVLNFELQAPSNTVLPDPKKIHVR